MLLGEPGRTQADLNFSLFGTPVRVHPFFWIIAVVLGDIKVPPAEILVRVAAFFAAILLHEYGHAVAVRACGLRPWITLYGLGGLTSYNPPDAYGLRRLGPRQQILISLAGPAAGFALAGAVIVLLLLVGYKVQIVFGGAYGVGIVVGQQVGSEYLDFFLRCLLFISIVWGILNLMPVYPLDGGQIAREIFLLASPRDGIRNSLLLSVIAAVGLAVYVAANGQFFAAFLFGYLAYSSYATLQAYLGRGPF